MIVGSCDDMVEQLLPGQKKPSMLDQAIGLYQGRQIRGSSLNRAPTRKLVAAISDGLLELKEAKWLLTSAIGSRGLLLVWHAAIH